MKSGLESFFRITKFCLVISIDSVRKETYEKIRSGGCLELVKRKITLINTMRDNSANHLWLSLNVIVMKSNYREITDVFDFAIENKFDKVIITPLYSNDSEFYEKEYLPAGSKEVQQHFS